MTLGIVALIELADCISLFSFGSGAGYSCADVVDPNMLSLVSGYVVAWGMPLTLLVAAGVSGLGGWLRGCGSA